jgi:hypothetical protein
MPRVGGRVTVEYLGATVRGVVIAVDPAVPQVEVETDDGARQTFGLNRATATFTAGASQTGARLRFLD